MTTLDHLHRLWAYWAVQTLSYILHITLPQYLPQYLKDAAYVLLPSENKSLLVSVIPQYLSQWQAETTLLYLLISSNTKASQLQSSTNLGFRK